MAHIITSLCLDYADCVAVCPKDVIADVFSLSIAVLNH